MVIDSATGAARAGIAHLPPLTLVLGGARSGKSRHAEALIATRGPGLYLATAEAGDDEMAARIAAHRSRRGASWTTLEEPLELAGTLARHATVERPILVDCLTLWLSNLMLAGRNLDTATHALITVLPGLAGPVVFVSNEVGLGIVPDNAMARMFRDLSGAAHQRLAEICTDVHFVVAGLPMTLKGPRLTESAMATPKTEG
jgi:adenosylcobinamide kinase/adenosylcobinamide-phosphate guanylyltransferase